MHGSKEAAVREMFAQIAPTYDLLNALLSFNVHVRWRRAAVEAARLSPGARVLDLATGTGDVALLAAEQVGAEGLVIGVDNCLPMLQAGVRKLARRSGTGIRMVVGRADSLPFADGVFDAALMAFALRNVPDPAGCLREMARVVRRGGWVVNLELTRPRHALLALVYRWYQDRLMPLIGGLLSGRREAYTYLPRSIQEFSPPQEVARWFEQAGLEEVSWQSLTGGLATLHRGRRR